MRYDRALLIIGQDIKSLYHHRGEHLARFLAKRFVNVDIVSIAKMYDGPGTDPIWKKALLGLRDILYKRVVKIWDGNIYHYVVRFPRMPGFVDYLLRDFWTFANVINHLNHYYDVCILAHPRLAYIAIKLKKLKRIKVLIYEDWDYFPGFLKAPFWRQIMKYKEQSCIRIADIVISVGSCLEELRRKQGVKRITVVSNGVDYALFRKAQQKNSHPPTLLYMGTLREDWGADLPIRALSLIRKRSPEVRYLILGSGPDEKKLRILVTKLHLDDCVHFLGMQEYQNLPNFLSKADIGVAISRENDFRKYASPLKIFEYMAAGLPVIGSNFGETRLIIEKSKAGLTAEFSPEAFAAAALDLLCDREKFENCSLNAIYFASQHDWERLFDLELDFINRPE